MRSNSDKPLHIKRRARSGNYNFFSFFFPVYAGIWLQLDLCVPVRLPVSTGCVRTCMRTESGFDRIVRMRTRSLLYTVRVAQRRRTRPDTRGCAYAGTSTACAARAGV